MSFLGSAGRWLDRQIKHVTRTVKGIPVVGSVVKVGEGALKGPIGKALESVVSNPVVETLWAPVTMPLHFAYAGTTGGLKGVTDAAKQELRNPVRRAVVSAVGAIFPPAAPAALALNAANATLDAAESGKPGDMIKAIGQIGAAAAGADVIPHLGDVMKVVNKAQQMRSIAAKAKGLVRFPNIHALNANWLGSTRANTVLEGLGPNAHDLMQPALVQNALTTLRKAAALKAGEKIDPTALAQAKQIAANAVAMGFSHPHVPFFVDLAKATHTELGPIMSSSNPNAKSIIAELETRIMAHTAARVAQLNALVHAYNRKEPPAVKQVADIHTAHQHGDHSATALLDDLRRRTAALKKASEYKVDSKGYTRHGGAGHPAAQPHGTPARPAARAPGHAAAHH